MRPPEPPYFVWDGACGFCGRWAGWIEDTVRPGVRLVAAQDLDDLADAGLGEDDVARASWWVAEDGPPQPGAAGIAAALRHGEPGWARLLGAVLGLPLIRSVAAFAYGRIAANRHRLPSPDRPAPERHPVEG